MTSRVAGEVFEILDSHRVDITRVEGLYCVCGYKLSIREELAGHHAAMLEQRGLLRPEIDADMIERARAVLSDEGFLPQNVLGEEHYPGYYNAVVRSTLESALEAHNG